MSLPATYTDRNETGCCAVPDTKNWDETAVKFEDKRFIRLYTRSLMHIPLNMSSVMTQLQKAAEAAGAQMPPQEVMILSCEISPWKAEQLYAVSKPVEGADNVELSGEYLSKVFEGPFANAKQWHQSLLDYVKSQGKTSQQTYFFYTTCPKCAKHYGKNYVIGLAQVA